MEKIQSEDNSDRLSACIRGKLSKLPPVSPKRCIYKIPEKLRQVNEHAYKPRLVSIGPYHHKDKSLLPMEEHKLRYLNLFLKSSQNADISIFLGIVKDSEPEIREFYAEATMSELSSDEFNLMVLIDSTFIIMTLLLRKPEATMHCASEDDQIYGRPYKHNEVARDIILAENQLPFFVLEGLYKAAFKPDNSSSSFTKLACDFLEIRYNENMEENSFHLLHLLQTSYGPSPPQREETKTKAVEVGIKFGASSSGYQAPAPTVNTLKEKLIRPTTVTTLSEEGNKFQASSSANQVPDPTVRLKYKEIISPTVTTMYEAGIKFEAAGSPGSLHDIQFDNGILTIPILSVDDKTESKFRNLTAFEHCHDKSKLWVSEYICFMNCLIDTQRDVELLAGEDIVENFLGSQQEVSDMFNSLGKNLPGTICKFRGMIELNEHCKKSCNHHIATLKHKYFENPWAAISVGYATLLIILTLISTVTGIISLV